MPAKTVNKVEQAMDTADYTAVVIVKSGTIEGHDYLRGTKHMVDADTLKALQAAGLIAPTS